MSYKQMDSLGGSDWRGSVKGPSSSSLADKSCIIYNFDDYLKCMQHSFRFLDVLFLQGRMVHFQSINLWAVWKLINIL